MEPLTPPQSYDKTRTVHHITIEYKDRHAAQMFDVAGAVGKAINPQVDSTRFHAWDEGLSFYPDENDSEALKLLMDLPENSPLQGRVIFSHSVEIPVNDPPLVIISSLAPCPTK